VVGGLNMQDECSGSHKHTGCHVYDAVATLHVFTTTTTIEAK